MALTCLLVTPVIDDASTERHSNKTRRAALNLVLLAFDLLPGASHWQGYTTFTKGVVISDELVVTRTDTLRSNEGKEIVAHERRNMLLNAAPSPTSNG
jgi:hypothetical protein